MISCDQSPVTYQKNQEVLVLKKNGLYQILPKNDHCNCCANSTYIVQDCHISTADDGTVQRTLILSRDSDLRIFDVSLYKHVITFKETLIPQGLKNGPGGPEVRENIRPHNGGVAMAAILTIGLTGIFYKMIAKIKEYQNTRTA